MFASSSSSSTASSSATKSTGFVPPPMYNFPPFFTLQPTDSTRTSQLEEWKRFILAWAANTKQSSIVINQWMYWSNPTLNRRLSEEGIRTVVEYLIQKGNAEWLDPDNKTTIHIFYKAPAEWANMILQQLLNLGYSHQLLTIYELRTGAVSHGTEFENLDADTVLKAIKVLENQNKVDIIPGDIPDETAIKVKV